MAELIPFKAEESGSFRFTRNVANRAKSELRFVGALGFVADMVGVQLVHDVRRSSVDIITKQESRHILQEHPSIEIGRMMGFLKRRRSRPSEHIGIFMSEVSLGSALAVPISGDIGVIGCPVEDVSGGFDKDREELRRLLCSAAGESVELATPAQYLLTFAEYKLEAGEGVEQVVDYVETHRPARTDLFDVQLYAGWTVRQRAGA